MTQKRKARAEKRKVNKVSNNADIEAEENDPIALMEAMRSEMTEMRGLYANTVALVQTQAIQLANQQASISDLQNRSPAKVISPAINNVSDSRDQRHAAIFIASWDAVNSNLKVQISSSTYHIFNRVHSVDTVH